MEAVGYIPLTRVWGQNGLAAVTFASLEDAGFHPLTDCDLRGWMHYFGWPLGSQRPVTIWVPDTERDEAARFLDAPVRPAWPAEPFEPGFSTRPAHPVG